MYKDIKHLSITYLTEPIVVTRTTDENFTAETNKDIARFPYLVCNDVGFEITFDFKDKYNIKIKDVIPAGFVYNMADIPFLLQPISYDKHSPYVKNASLIHDYILKGKKDFYKLWQLKDYGMDHRDFRILTSDIFEKVLIQDGVPARKARRMRNSVDIFQKLFVWNWMGVK